MVSLATPLVITLLEVLKSHHLDSRTTSVCDVSNSNPSEAFLPSVSDKTYKIHK